MAVMAETAGDERADGDDADAEGSNSNDKPKPYHDENGDSDAEEEKHFISELSDPGNHTILDFSAPAAASEH